MNKNKAITFLILFILILQTGYQGGGLTPPLVTATSSPNVDHASLKEQVTSLLVNASSLLYIFGFGTSGDSSSSSLQYGQYASVTDQANYTVASIAITTHSQNSFTTSSSNQVMGGVGVSGYSTYLASYSTNNTAGATSASEAFSVSGSGSLVVVFGIGGGEQCISLGGVPGLSIDATSPTAQGNLTMRIAHAYPVNGSYNATETTSQCAAGQDPNHAGDIIGVFVFLPTTSSPTIPSTPWNLQGTAGAGLVSLSWNSPATDGGSGITGYKVYRGPSSGGETLLASLGVQSSYTDSSVRNGLTYYYEVTAVNGVGESIPSNEVVVTPHTSQSQVNHVGDLVVSGSQVFVIENEIYNQTGNVYVRDSGTLIIRNATLILWFNGTNYNYQLQGNINVTLIIETNSVVTSNNYFFIEASGAYSLLIRDSTISGGDLNGDGPGGIITITNSVVEDFIGLSYSLSVSNSTVEFLYVNIQNPSSITNSEIFQLQVNPNPGTQQPRLTILNSSITVLTLNLHGGTANLSLKPGIFQLWKLSQDGVASGIGIDLWLENVTVSQWSISTGNTTPLSLTIANSDIALNTYAVNLNPSNAFSVSVRDSLLRAVTLRFPQGNSTISSLSPGNTPLFHLSDHITSTSPVVALTLTNTTVTRWLIRTGGSVYRKITILNSGLFRVFDINGVIEMNDSTVQWRVDIWAGQAIINRCTMYWLEFLQIGDTTAIIRNSNVTKWVGIGSALGGSMNYDLHPGLIGYWNSHANGTYSSSNIFDATILNSQVAGWRILGGFSTSTISGDISWVDAAADCGASQINLHDATVGTMSLELFCTQASLSLNPGLQPLTSLLGVLNLTNTRILRWRAFLGGTSSASLTGSNLTEILMGDTASLLLHSSTVGTLSMTQFDKESGLAFIGQDDIFGMGAAAGSASIVDSTIGQLVGTDLSTIKISNQHSPTLGDVILKFGAKMQVTNATVKIEGNVVGALSAFWIKNGAIVRRFIIVVKDAQGNPVPGATVTVNGAQVGVTNATGYLVIHQTFTSPYEAFTAAASGAFQTGQIMLQLNSPLLPEISMGIISVPLLPFQILLGVITLTVLLGVTRRQTRKRGSP